MAYALPLVVVAPLALVVGSASPAYADAPIFFGTTASLYTGPWKQATVSCGYGNGSPTGSGFSLHNGANQVYVDKFGLETFSYPYQSFEATVVRATDDADGYGGSWSVRAQVICHAFIPSVYTVTVTGSLHPSSSAASAACQPGDVVLSGGVSNSGYDTHGHVTALRPIVSGGQAKVLGQVRRDPVAGPGNVRARVTARCANPLPGYQIVSAQVSAGSSPTATAAATCPAGKHLYGLGFYVTKSGVIINGAEAVTSSTVWVGAVESQVGGVDDWLLNAYAFCAF